MKIRRIAKVLIIILFLISLSLAVYFFYPKKRIVCTTHAGPEECYVCECSYGFFFGTFGSPLAACIGGPNAVCEPLN